MRQLLCPRPGTLQEFCLNDMWDWNMVTHAHTYTCMHTWRHPCKSSAWMICETEIWSHMHTHIHACTHEGTLARVLLEWYVRLKYGHTCTHIYMHAHMKAPLQEFCLNDMWDWNMVTHAHTYTCMHTWRHPCRHTNNCTISPKRNDKKMRRNPTLLSSFYCFLSYINIHLENSVTVYPPKTHTQTQSTLAFSNPVMRLLTLILLVATSVYQ